MTSSSLLLLGCHSGVAVTVSCGRAVVVVAERRRRREPWHSQFVDTREEEESLDGE
jgi:hypothetical protein